MGNANTKETTINVPNPGDKDKDASKKADVTKEPAIFTDNEVLIRADAATKVRDSVLLLLPFRIFSLIWHYGWNPGGRKPDDHLSLVKEILAVGMTSTPVVSCRVKVKELVELMKSDKNDEKVVKALWGLRGHLRSIVVKQAKVDSPVAFEKHWGKGVPVEVVEGLTPVQELYIAEDHDTISRDKLTVIRQIINMFICGLSVRAVTLKMWDELLTHFNALNGKQKAKIAAASGDAAKIREMLDIKRGTVQNLGYLATKLPDYCLAAYIKTITGEDGDKLKLGDAVHLNTAQGTAGTKANPTKKFTDLYKSCIANYGKASSGVKPMNTKERFEFFGTFKSKLGEAIRMHIDREANFDFTNIDIFLQDSADAGHLVSPILEEAAASIQKRLDAANAS
jgi:hypothetical protein